MIKPSAREPLTLNRPNLNFTTLYTDQSRELQPNKQTFQYDFQVFQQSLNIHKTRVNQQACLRHGQIESSIKIRGNSNSNITYQNVTRLNSSREGQSNFNRNINACSGLQFRKKQQFKNQAHHLSNIHQTKLSLKPKLQKYQNKENFMNPPTRRNDIIQEMKMFSNNHSVENKINEDKLWKEQQIIKQRYERRIKQLQEKNEQSQRKIQSLQIQLKDKEQLALRVEEVQKKFNQLYEQNQELYKINQSLSNSRLSSYQEEPTILQSCIQTQNFAVFVQDAFCQTRAFQIQAQLAKRQGDNEQKLKKYKIQCEQLKISLMNKENQFKLLLENIKAQNQQKLDRRQKQYKELKAKYESNCQQLINKQDELTKYYVNKL